MNDFDVDPTMTNCTPIDSDAISLESTGFEPTGFEPELGGVFRDAPDRTGFEPELGGILRQKGVYVDEIACIGCKHCAHVAPNTFYMEPEHGRARAIRQDGDPEAVVEEAMDTCPVNCISWVDYTELKELEAKRKFQVIPVAGFPLSAAAKNRKK